MPEALTFLSILFDVMRIIVGEREIIVCDYRKN